MRVPELSLSSAGASIVAIAGAVVLLRCVWDFFAKRRGTLAPIDPPRVLILSGLYRFTRNPMYNGVLALILGEAWLFGNMSLRSTVRYGFDCRRRVTAFEPRVTHATRSYDVRGPSTKRGARSAQH